MRDDVWAHATCRAREGAGYGACPLKRCCCRKATASACEGRPPRVGVRGQPRFAVRARGRPRSAIRARGRPGSATGACYRLGSVAEAHSQPRSASTSTQFCCCRAACTTGGAPLGGRGTPLWEGARRRVPLGGAPLGGLPPGEASWGGEARGARGGWWHRPGLEAGGRRRVRKPERERAQLLEGKGWD